MIHEPERTIGHTEGMASKRGPKAPLSPAHRAALAAGRNDARAVRAYLEVLDPGKSRRSERKTPEEMERRLAEIEVELRDADVLRRLALIQDRLDLVRELDAARTGHDVAALEDAFVAVAREYGQRKRISYAAWREIGVPPSVLKRAGIKRTA